MTAAQKKAKENFKKAIAYRKISGCTLKEAFAKIYNKKTAPLKKATSNLKKLVDKAKKAYKEGYEEAAKEIAKKKAAKRVGAAPKKKAAKKVVKKAAPKKAARKVVKKAAPKRSVSLHKDTKSHNVNIRVMSGIGKVDKGLFKNLAELKAFHKEKGGHFFDRQTMKFFSTKIESTLIGGKYFIYSNKMPYYDRYYKIAEAYPSGNVFPLENSPQFESKVKAKEYLLKKVLKH